MHFVYDEASKCMLFVYLLKGSRNEMTQWIFMAENICVCCNAGDVLLINNLVQKYDNIHPIHTKYILYILNYLTIHAIQSFIIHWINDEEQRTCKFKKIHQCNF